eukprot:IDg1860t1
MKICVRVCRVDIVEETSTPPSQGSLPRGFQKPTEPIFFISLDAEVVYEEVYSNGDGLDGSSTNQKRAFGKK